MAKSLFEMSNLEKMGAYMNVQTYITDFEMIIS